MFKTSDYIYKKKYMGNELQTDTSIIYSIIHIYNTKSCIHNNTIFEKWATLNNGDEQLLYTYNIITKKREYYIEKTHSWYNNIWCCM